MMETISRAAALRQEFDRSFADPPLIDVAAKEDLLAIRLATQEFAIRLSEIAGLFADKKITPVPSANSALLGITGFVAPSCRSTTFKGCSAWPRVGRAGLSSRPTHRWRSLSKHLSASCE